MSIQAVAWALEQDMPNAPLKLVLVALCNHADRDTGSCFPSIRTLMREASMSRSSVQRQIKALADAGIVEVGATFDKSGRQSSNGYRIVFDPAEQEKNRRAQGGCQIDTLPCGPAVDDVSTTDGGEGFSLTPPVGQADRGEGVTADTPNTNHQNEPYTPLSPHIATQDRFHELVKNWRAEHLGSEADAWKTFQRLSADDQRKAIGSASTFRTAMALRKKKIPKLAKYLADRLFIEFHDAPELDRDGDFKITPSRPEWGPHLGDLRRRFGALGVERVVMTGFYVTPNRWPEALPAAPQKAAE